jgi:deoxyribonuclease-1
MATRKQPQKAQQKPMARNTIAMFIMLVIAFASLVFTGNVSESASPKLTESPKSTEIPTGEPQKATPLPKTQGNTSNESFAKSKRMLMDMYINAGQVTEFYCGSTFDADGNIDHSKSGFHFRKNEKRANRIEWEHIVPAEAFGQAFKEWREGDAHCMNSKGKLYKGRNCAEKANKEFRLMQADMYNLVPANGEVNGDRSNYSYAMLEGEKREYGTCNMEIEDQKAEPPDNRFGEIARTYWYMNAAYPGKGIISKKNVKLFEAWNKMNPVNAWECERNRLLEKLQGNINQIVAAACQVAGL